MRRAICGALFFCFTLPAFAGETIYFLRSSDAAAGVPERVLKNAGYNLVTEFDGGSRPAVWFNLVESVSEDGRMGVWTALLGTMYPCAINNKPIVLQGSMQLRTEWVANPTIPQGRKKIAAAAEYAAKEVISNVRSDEMKTLKSQCENLQRHSKS